MGGFYNTVAKLATEGTEKLGAKIFGQGTAHALSESVESGLYHGIFPAKTAFQDIPAAKALWDHYQGPYQEVKNKLISQGVQTAQAAGSVKPHHEIVSEASRKAQDIAFGQNRSSIQGVLKHVEKTVGKNRADILADHLNIMFKEETDSQGLSRFDRDMRKKSPDNDGFNTPPSPYKRPGPVESNVLRTKNAMLAYKAAIPHLASNLNILISDGFQNYAKVLATNFGPGRKGAEATVLATNAISELWYTGYREKQAFDNGIIKKYAPGGVGEFIHRNLYIPGMSRVRYETLLMSAHASKLAAEEASAHLMRGNDKMALPMLRELGLDAAKIKSQRGVLLQEDIDKAYYHGTNTRAFLNQADNRTALSQQSAIYRVMGSFHNYISSQSQFLRRTFKRQYEQGDFIGIARNIGLMSMAFPVLGATIYESERLLAGNDWDDPSGHLRNRVEATPAGQIYDSLTGRENAASTARTALNTIDNLSHLASFGVATGYVRGAARNNLAGQMLGPVPNMLVQAAQDFGKALTTDERHPHAAEPLERDALSDTLPYGIGSMLTHKILPTTKEKSKNKFHKFTRMKKQSSNPLNANDDFNY
jgi:hypothetical protein